MMTSTLSKDQAKALASLIGALRPDWEPQGVMAALLKARDRGNAHDVAHAALRAAEITTNRTPAVIPMPGAHWLLSTTTPLAPAGVPAAGSPRCEIPGHEAELAHNCRACRAERMGRDENRTDTLAMPEDQAATNAAGAALVRAALTNPQRDEREGER